MQFQNNKDKVLIIDFGSQVTKLIARRIRELGVYSEIITPKDLNKLKIFHDIKGLILSGGPSTVTEKKFQSVSKDIFEKKIPILGICYGLQLIAKIYGGKIKSSKKKREFGRAFLYKKNSSLLTKNFLNNKRLVWMSHEDVVVKLPKNFKLIASTKESKLTIIENTIIQTLKFYKIKTFPDKDNIGIWYNDNDGIKKIAAIGIKVSKWIAYHGFAININNDLDDYKKIIPCGISDKGITNLKKIIDQNYSNLSDKLIENFIFNLKI